MTADQRLFDASAACALWNAGERTGLELKNAYSIARNATASANDATYCFLILTHPAHHGSTHRIITVKLNPDDTIEPAPETWGR